MDKLEKRARSALRLFWATNADPDDLVRIITATLRDSQAELLREMMKPSAAVRFLAEGPADGMAKWRAMLLAFASEHGIKIEDEGTSHD